MESKPLTKREVENLKAGGFAHAMYINPELPDICPQCKAEYDAAMAEDDDD